MSGGTGPSSGPRPGLQCPAPSRFRGRRAPGGKGLNPFFPEGLFTNEEWASGGARPGDVDCTRGLSPEE